MNSTDKPPEQIQGNSPTTLNGNALPPASDYRPLLDGATPSLLTLDPELEAARRIAADPTQPLEDRLEAYEDIFDSEVGDTSLSRARNIERETGLRQVFLKFEGGNPSGTHKDRIAFAQAMDALRRGFDTIAVATCGNYGAAMAFAAKMAGLKCLIYVPTKFQAGRIPEMEKYGAEIIRVETDYEGSVEFSREQSEKREFYDANPGGANTAIQLKAYGEIAFEIYDELRDAPAAIAVPVSNATTLAGIYKGFLSLYRRGKTSRIPRMVAGSSYGKNPVVQAFLKGAEACEDLRPDKIRETSINEPLVNWHSIDGDLALQAIYATYGWAANASDKSMVSYAKKIRESEGLSVLPASTAGLIALISQHATAPLPSDRYVVMLTWRKS
ncbi:pyridoxal-phosphate dependent enzyme [bacterium]|nr:pyridoxal-phosphate dependent enzyme [bacterium]